MGKTRPIFMKKESKFSLFRVLIVVMIAAFILGVSYIVVMARIPGGVGTKMPDFGTIKPGEIFKPGNLVFKDKDEIVILCIGLDENRDERGIAHHKGSRTDTIFLLKINKEADRLGMLSIPRDTLVEISEKYGRDKINSAYSVGFLDEYDVNGHDYEKAKAAGIHQVRKTVSKFMGVPIDYYVLIKISSAKELVNAIGGINVDVEKDMDYDDNWGNLHIHLKKGRQKLDGDQIVGYSRFRHDEEGDWGRIRRQQQVIKAMVKELKDPSNIMKINKLAEVIKKNVETDIPFAELIDMAHVYKDFNKDNMVRGVVLGTDVTWGGAASLEPVEEEKARLINRILKNPGDLKEKDLRVRIYNGSGVSGIANKLADDFRKKGIQVIDVGNAEKEEVEKTVIEDHYFNKEWTEKFKEMLDKEDIKVVRKASDDREQNPDYTIIIGKDFPTKKEQQNPDDTPVLPKLEPDGPGEELPASDTPSPILNESDNL